MIRQEFCSLVYPSRDTNVLWLFNEHRVHNVNLNQDTVLSHNIWKYVCQMSAAILLIRIFTQVYVITMTSQ